jgi:hypothetical protein
MDKDALEAHARDELGLSETTKANPAQAAMASAISFALGAASPLAVAALAPGKIVVISIGAVSLIVPAARRCWRRFCGSPSGARWPCASPPASDICSERWSEGEVERQWPQGQTWRRRGTGARLAGGRERAVDGGVE